MYNWFNSCDKIYSVFYGSQHGYAAVIMSMPYHIVKTYYGALHIRRTRAPYVD